MVKCIINKMKKILRGSRFFVQNQTRYSLVKNVALPLREGIWQNYIPHKIIKNIKIM